VSSFRRILSFSSFLHNDDYRTGLPISTYFSAIKLHWMLEHHPSVQEAHTNNTLLFGTIDSWIVYNLTLSPSSSTIQKPLHITDPTNASRSLLLSLSSLTWSQPLLQFFSLNPNILPTLRSSSEPYAPIAKGRPLEGTMIAGIVGDQQAALVGNKCLMKGEAKNTYGTGAFLLFNTGTEVVKSRNGLIGTVSF
jgi:glycerol kinase